MTVAATTNPRLDSTSTTLARFFQRQLYPVHADGQATSSTRCSDARSAAGSAASAPARQVGSPGLRV